MADMKMAPDKARGKMAKGKGKPPMGKPSPIGRGAPVKVGSAPKPRNKMGKGTPSAPLDSETLGSMAQSLKGMSGTR
jgi:hypothetical protein